MAGAAVTSDLLDVLRQAFAAEVAERLPSLRGDDPEAVRRDAHTFVTSAAVVGEPEISRLAREVESGGPVDALVAALEQWAP